jgi:uroporphyrinogen-III synthase
VLRVGAEVLLRLMFQCEPCGTLDRVQAGLSGRIGTRRGVLARVLAARGATVHVAHVYRREAMAPAPARLRALDALPASSALLLTSREAFAPLWDALAPAQQARLRQRPCVVASDRMAAFAAAAGFRDVVRAGAARPGALLDALARHAAPGRFR